MGYIGSLGSMLGWMVIFSADLVVKPWLWSVVGG
jgi:hypothetical protein